MKITLILEAIQNALYETSTMHQLTSNADVFFDTPRKQMSTQVQLTHVKYIPSVGEAILVVKGQTRTTEKTYESTIQFSKVKYLQDKESPYASTFMVGQDEFKIMPIKINMSDVQVHCSCPDFYWRFANHNNANKSLIGEPPAPYVKKTNRAPLNPEKVPGACKHLMKLSDHLKMEKIIK